MFICTLFFLLGAFFLTATIAAFRRLNKKDSLKQIKEARKTFFYYPLHHYFFPHHEYESLFFASSCALNLARFGYVASGVILLLQTNLVKGLPLEISPNIDAFWLALCFITLIFGSFVIGDYLPKIFGTRLPENALKISLPFSSIYLYLAFPLSFLLLKISQSISRDFYFDSIHEPSSQAKQEIIDLIQDAEVSPTLDIHDKKLIESVLMFKERSAKEVMVPRVDMFSLPADTSIKDAAHLLHEEGYSRTPLYKNSVDNIVGVLMYKDVLKKYMEYAEHNDPKILEAPVESIQKNILYAPETKKISSLLQEFRKKQVHFAIVVDEYGGTEGIVTIEDILEEIVGDIADEYDQENQSFKQLPDGSWIVDAKMSIWDVEEYTGIQIPEEEEYDSIGGYVFHVAGAIPSPGFIVHNDEFELEILESSNRAVEKVRIKSIDKP
jgi:putative hemolysin